MPIGLGREARPRIREGDLHREALEALRPGTVQDSPRPLKQPLGPAAYHPEVGDRRENEVAVLGAWIWHQTSGGSNPPRWES